MHANSLKNLKSWPKGVSGNPHGRRPIPESLQGIRSLSLIETIKIISKYARMTKKEMRAVQEDQNTSVLDLSIISIFQASMREADHSKLNFLLDRCVGKVKDQLEGDDDLDEREQLQKLSVNELLTLVKTHMPEEFK